MKTDTTDRNCKFSIIMPCYNSEAYVRNAIESVLHQTYNLWEYVIVNDGSTDHTPSILQEYADQDDRIKTVNKTNGGYVTAINAGLEHISGDYFLVMGSDDALAVDLLQTLNNAICACAISPDSIVFQTQMLCKEQDPVLDPVTAFDGMVFQKNTSLKEFAGKYPNHAASIFCRDTSKCYKTANLGTLRYFGRYGIAADGIFSMLFSHRSESFLCIPHVGYFWERRNESVSSTGNVYKTTDQIQNWTLFFKALSEYPPACVAEVELLYIKEQRRLILSLASSFKSAVEYRKFIKKHGKELVATARRYDRSQYLTPSLRTASAVPVTFSVYARLRKKYKAFVGRIFAE